MRFTNPVFLSPLAAQIAVCAFVTARRPGLIRAEPLSPARQGTIPSGRTRKKPAAAAEKEVQGISPKERNDAI